jgi:hypothetical protein
MRGRQEVNCEAILGQSQRDAVHRLQVEHAPSCLMMSNQGAIKACAPAA